jgi:sporulation protein YlmC with PRC-barrel domain
LEERGLVGLEARAADGTEIGRISDVITDEESGEVTHVLVEMEEGEEVEVSRGRREIGKTRATFRTPATRATTHT